ncbi:hypothetical protein Tco_1216990 [Tanacetum coccineum]
MSDSEHSTVTYTSVSFPVEDDSDIGSPGVDGPPIMPEDPYAYIMVAYEVPPSPDYIPSLEVPPSPDYIPCPEEPQSPPPLDFVPEPMYPEYMPQEDETLCTGHDVMSLRTTVVAQSALISELQSADHRRQRNTNTVGEFQMAAWNPPEASVTADCTRRGGTVRSCWTSLSGFERWNASYMVETPMLRTSTPEAGICYAVENTKKDDDRQECPRGRIKKLDLRNMSRGLVDTIHGSMMADPKPTYYAEMTLKFVTESGQKVQLGAEHQADNKRKSDDTAKNNQESSNQQRQNPEELYDSRDKIVMETITKGLKPLCRDARESPKCQHWGLIRAVLNVGIEQTDSEEPLPLLHKISAMTYSTAARVRYLFKRSILSKKEHEEHLRQILKLLKKEELYAKFSKCEFWISRVQFLGHVIDYRGIHVDPAKIESIKDWASPKTHNRDSFDCGAKQEADFQLLKQMLCKLQQSWLLPRGNRRFLRILRCFKVRIGAVLCKDEKGRNREPLRVRALVMDYCLDLPKQILRAQTEARNPENIKKEDVGGILVENSKDPEKLRTEKLEPRTDGTMCLKWQEICRELYWWPIIESINRHLCLARCLPCAKRQGISEQSVTIGFVSATGDTSMEEMDPMDKLARMYLKEVVTKHGIPVSIICDCDPRLASNFWRSLQKTLGTSLDMRSYCLSSVTDGQSEVRKSKLSRICYVLAVNGLGNGWVKL